jgi:hypothetical protein
MDTAGLRQMELVGGAREAQVPGDGFENLELVQRCLAHVRSSIHIASYIVYIKTIHFT